MNIYVSLCKIKTLFWSNCHFRIRTIYIEIMCHRSELSFAKFRAFSLSAVVRRKGRRSHLQGCDSRPSSLPKSEIFLYDKGGGAWADTSPTLRRSNNRATLAAIVGKGRLLLRVNKALESGIAASLPRLTQLRYFFFGARSIQLWIWGAYSLFSNLPIPIWLVIQRILTILQGVILNRVIELDEAALFSKFEIAPFLLAEI